MISLYPTIKIIRVEESEQGTFGVMTICNQVFCITLELPDRLNLANSSSIPAGQYLCKKVSSPRFGETFEITNVPERSHVLFHAGNRIKDSRGCILLAQYFGKLQGDRAVLNSGKTFEKFMETLEGIELFSLTIREAY